jgi:hypothetical protein
MRRYLIGLIAGLILGGSSLAYASSMGAAPQKVNLAIPCQRANQLNCTWYGQHYAARTSENPPLYTQTYWTNFVKPNGKTFCQYRLVPARMLTCANHWPLVASDY